MDFVPIKQKYYVGISRRESPCQLVSLNTYNHDLLHDECGLVGVPLARFLMLPEGESSAQDCEWLGKQLEVFLDEVLEQLDVALIELYPAMKPNAAPMLGRLLTDQRLKFCAVLHVTDDDRTLSAEADWSSLRVSGSLSTLNTAEGQHLIKRQVAWLVLTRLAGWLPKDSGALSDICSDYSLRKQEYLDDRQLPLWFVRGVAAWLAGNDCESQAQAITAVTEGDLLNENSRAHSEQDYRVYAAVVSWLCSPVNEGGAGNGAHDLANLFRACNTTSNLHVIESLLEEANKPFSFRGLSNRFVASISKNA